MATNADNAPLSDEQSARRPMAITPKGQDFMAWQGRSGKDLFMVYPADIAAFGAGWEAAAARFGAVIQQLRDYSQIPSREYAVKYPRDNRNRIEIFDAALTEIAVSLRRGERQDGPDEPDRDTREPGPTTR